MRLLRRPRHSGGTRASVTRERRGFTMVELLTVAVVMGTLVRVAIPNFHEVVIRARAAEVVGDFETVRVAVLNYHADRLEWPADAYTGQVPAGLERYLPPGFDFRGAGYRLDWENWTLPDGLPRDPSTGVLLGISVVTEDRELGHAVRELLGTSTVHYALGDTYTFVVDRM